MNILNINQKMKIHFIGIGGIGMSGIAELMLDQGYQIQGSDLYVNENIKRLRNKGAKIYLGHKKSNINNSTAAVFSSAIKKSNVEILECKKLSIPLVSRADMLAELMREKNAIAIAGSHGKTTTTSIIGTILENAKMDPTIINGGIINSYLKNNRLGFGKWMVVEADESDGSFLKLPHEINVITNIDSEHLDYYKNDKAILEAFEIFIQNLPFYGCSVICIDNKNSYKLSRKINTRKIITYSQKNKDADVKINITKQTKLKTDFTVKIKKGIINKYFGVYKFKTNLIGHHNILNGTAGIICSLLVGSSIKNIQKSLINFKGVKRRFTFLGKLRKSLIYDDYAHHPTEIKASYELAKIIAKKKIILIFQPHRYSRTLKLYSDFIKVLKKFDYIYILDIYPAGEKPIKKINSKNLTKDLNKKNSKSFYLKNTLDLKVILSKHYNQENLIIFMGAGSVTNEAYKLINEENVSRNFKII